MENNYNRLYRQKHDRVIAGVASGLAKYFNVDPLLVRIVFVVLALLNGFGILLYILLAIFVPEENTPEKAGSMSETISDRAQELAAEVKTRTAGSGHTFGLLLILIGLIFLLRELFPNFLRMDLFWPALLVIVGLVIILRNNQK